ncbi:hypothetical protein [Pseudohongiella acticola]|uniref:hypothetical protein n=1 Tax=Pseudohongiella acticola TaxID=1524254 RepID=UPI00111321F8|nr:hypothetical protein [Pseudohongiella acticola]
MSNAPDLTWYSNRSKESGESIRCPFATVWACPRYYQSLSLSSELGSTQISENEDKLLLKVWEASDLWPRTKELASSVSTFGSNFSSISRFCPEVTYERLGPFCSSLHSYSGEIDQDNAHKVLGEQGAAASDFRWNWQHTEAQHYLDCPIYAVLKARPIAQHESPVSPWWREQLAQIVLGVVVAVAAAFIGLWVR